MAVESVSGGCGSEVNMFIHDSSEDEHYIPHLSESYFHTKFKIDPNDLYTFHDSDVIAGEITVSHTDDSLIFPDSADTKPKFSEYSNKDIDILTSITNGDVKTEKNSILTNGHYSPVSNNAPVNQTDCKAIHAKVQKAKSQTNSLPKVVEARQSSISSPKNQSNQSSAQYCLKPATSIAANNEKPSSTAKSNAETFLDVFKREQGVTENSTMTIKTEPILTPIKTPAPAPKKPQTGNCGEADI